jgi:hypothetical protein
MASLPSNLSFFMQRMQGVSTSHFKIFPQSSDNATAGKIIRFEIPSNAYVNMKKLRFMFNADTTGTCARLPDDISSLIERVAVYMGGSLIQNNFNGYNTLVKAKSSLCGSKASVALGHPEIVRAVSYHSGNGISSDDPESYTSQDLQLCIDNWEGLLGSIEPSIIDTGLLPQITVEITLADNNVCTTSKSTALIGTASSSFGIAPSSTAVTYTLSNLSLQCEVLGFSTSLLDQLVEQRISSVGYLSLPFKNYYSFQSTHNGNTRWNVNSASWDRVWLCYRATGYASGGVPHAVKGYKKSGAFVAASSGGSVNVDIGVPQYDNGGSLNTNAEKYISPYFRFQTGGDANTNYQLQINGASVPAYRMNLPEAYAVTMNSIDMYDKDHKLTLDQYKDSAFVQCYRFCLPDSDFNRLASGLDVRSTSAMATLETQNLTECALTIFAECTAELRVGAQRAIEVVN